GSKSPNYRQFNIDDYKADIAVDRDGNIYVQDYGNYQIQKYDSNGKFLIKWGGKGSINGNFNGLGGIAVDLDNNIYAVDGNKRIQKFTCKGKFITKWKITDFTGIKVNRNKDVYGYSWHDMVKYDSKGNIITHWPVPPSNPDMTPQGSICEIAINSKNNIFVLHINLSPEVLAMHWSPDYKSEDTFYAVNTLLKYSANGGLLKEYELYDEKKKRLYNCHSITIDSKDNIFISGGSTHHCIWKFDSEYNLITKFGSEGSGNGQFKSPCSIAVDLKGNVYVMDNVNCCIQKFAPVIKSQKL
ncbi:MAG: hypothetical protein ABRQ39_32075, partial [Candidatus Eremiobacterota bacterium]